MDEKQIKQRLSERPKSDIIDRLLFAYRTITALEAQISVLQKAITGEEKRKDGKSVYFRRKER